MGSGCRSLLITLRVQSQRFCYQLYPKKVTANFVLFYRDPSYNTNVSKHGCIHEYIQCTYDNLKIHKIKMLWFCIVLSLSPLITVLRVTSRQSLKITIKRVKS